jgi:acetoin utilization protein AcuB
MNSVEQPRVHQFPTVREYMSPSPVTINGNRPLAFAQTLMREHGIRHLPVLDGGAVVGLLSERDVLLVESIPGVNPTVVRAEEAMVQNVFQVAADDPIADVVQTMIDRKLGSAVVLDEERIVGVFTTIDALRALHERLEAH